MMGISNKFFNLLSVLILMLCTNISANDRIPTIKDYLNDTTSAYDSYIYGLALIVVLIMSFSLDIGSSILPGLQ